MGQQGTGRRLRLGGFEEGGGGESYERGELGWGGRGGGEGDVMSWKT